MSATAISWIVTIAFLVILAAGFLVGLWRGLKKSLFSMIASFVGVIIAFFLTPVITNAVMGIKVNSEGMNIPLNELIISILRKNSDINTLMNNNPNMEAFFQKLPFAIGNAVIFILFTIAIELVLYIIYRIIASIFMKRKEGESVHRLGGAFIGLGTIFVIVIFAFMPLASLVSTADQLTTTDEYTVEADVGESAPQGLLNDMLPAQALDAIKGVNNSLLTKVSSVFGMHNVLFDYYANVTIDNQKIYLRQEIVNYYSALDFLNQLRQNSITFAKLNYDKINKIKNNIEEGGLFKVLVPSTLRDLIVNYEDYSFLRNNSTINEYHEIIVAIGNDIRDLSAQDLYNYIKNDIDKTFETLRLLGENGIIDGVKDLGEKSAKTISNLLTNDENFDNFKSAIRNVFDINTVKNSLSTITKKLVEKVNLEHVDQVATDTSEWVSEKWDALATNITDATKDLATMLNQVEFDVIYDITKLLDTTQNYNITSILTNLGRLIDKVRDNDLLRNAADESIFEPLLTHYNLTLPEGEVENYSTGANVSIENYTQLMQFIAPAIEKVKSSNLYTIMQNENADEVVEGLANVVSQEGNEDILREVLLPFYQINVTKEKIFDKISTLNNDLVNFGNLTSYGDWKKDLGYITQVLLALTDEDAKVGDETYLKLIMNGGIDTIFDNITDAQVDTVFKPILYAKSTAGVRENIASTIKTTLDEITSPAGSTIDMTAVTLVEGDTEDQAQEICNVLKEFVKVNKTYSSGDTIRDIDKTNLGTMLENMKLNAYRVDLAEKTEQGLFKGAFINIMTTFKTQFAVEVTYLETVKHYNFSQDNYKNLNFIQIMADIAEYESLVP